MAIRHICDLSENRIHPNQCTNYLIPKVLVANRTGVNLKHRYASASRDLPLWALWTVDKKLFTDKKQITIIV